MPASCTRCKDTGTARWGGFYGHRGPDVLCDCEAGDRLRRTPEQIRADVEARVAAQTAARHARRAAAALADDTSVELLTGQLTVAVPGEQLELS